MTEAELKGFADHYAVRILIEEYASIVTMRAWVELGPLWTVDGVFRTIGTPNALDIRGRDAIVQGISRVVDTFDMLIHHLSAPRITIDGDRATATCVLQELVSVDSGRGVNMYGIYEDEIVREPEGWRFAQRTFNAYYVHAAPLPGKVISQKGGSRGSVDLPV